MENLYLKIVLAFIIGVIAMSTAFLTFAKSLTELFKTIIEIFLKK